MASKRIFSSDYTLGILGGGQLGKMLLYETRKLDIATHVMDSSPAAPGRLAANTFVEGDLMDEAAVIAFAKAVNTLTIEIENVSVNALEKLENQGLNCYPSSSTLKLIRNKATQKQFYIDNNIPTAAFQRYESAVELRAQYTGSYPFVWKAATGGYDGMGVQVVKSKNQLESLKGAECIAEEMVNFKMELAVIVARSAGGKRKAFPVVEMEFHPEANQVEYVICPARIPEDIALKATQLALDVSEKMNHVGLLAVEMFLTQKDEIIINEVAPRPHNSGHSTIEGCYTNQFEQHIRAVLNLPLGSTAIKCPTVMVNLVGEEGHTGDVVYENIEEVMAMPGVTVHIYGKKETRPFRKMGHITIADDSLDEARKRAAIVKNTIKVISKQ